ncbi:MAG TPA: thioredoxin-like domain-containing protein [Bacteroidota bacterium]|nr:thioredoxin-like domain-containing protein [Bacteroidota bacterium]
MKQLPMQKIQAPEICGDFWFNSDPLTIRGMEGEVILLCFWDYTSEASLNTMKYVEEWNRRYREMGLVVIGIHSPEFSFARDPKLVESAIARYGYRFPVATDNTSMMRDAYRVQELPTLVLLERDGSLYLTHAGEGGYERAERAIQSLLRESGFHGELPMLIEFSRVDESVHSLFERATPAIRTGYLHGSLGNVEGYSPELPAEYSDAHEYIEGKFYAQGNWFAKSEAIEFEKSEKEGYIALRYSGNNVNVVMSAEKRGAVVIVLQDDKALSVQQCGNDITVDHEGNSVVIVDEPKLFHIIKNSEFGERTIKLIPKDEGTTFYSFSFDANPVSVLQGLGNQSFRNN